MMNSLFEPSVAHRFIVSVFIDGIPSPTDFRFQRVSGLSRTLQGKELTQGGDNVGNYFLPESVSHPHIVLERGVSLITPLMLNFNQMMSSFKAQYATIIIMLTNSLSVPVCTWTLTDALPVSWHTADLDANSSTVLINTLELAYKNMHFVGGRA